MILVIDIGNTNIVTGCIKDGKILFRERLSTRHTATTITAINRDKQFLGGAIMPGVAVSHDALIDRTSQLSKIALERPKKVIGSNTIECIKSGIIYGNAGAIDGIIDRFREELGDDCTVVATGGLAEVIVPLCKNKIIIDEDLLLKGLMLIYEKNK